MFKKNFIDLCNKKGESPSAVCRKVDITPATFSGWTEKTVPRQATLHRIADYFGVTVEDLLSDGQEKTPATDVTPSELQDAIEKLNAILPNLSEEDKDKLIDYGHYLIQKQSK